VLVTALVPEAAVVAVLPELLPALTTTAATAVTAGVALAEPLAVVGALLVDGATDDVLPLPAVGATAAPASVLLVVLVVLVVLVASVVEVWLARALLVAGISLLCAAGAAAFEGAGPEPPPPPQPASANAAMAPSAQGALTGCRVMLG